ncbi:hypothetical protein L1987_12598 [Smallanthus sonchifolius]|uniref:Uncharacterized protein n=1 Tax=Smallanthus sonchifolius TaxID=185202 RepID=A0ACB9JF37_9ASTR|nr:hypothetical protein L1987_12598 [Smallanthus sonchifolius]
MGNCCLKGSRSSTTVWADENDQWVYYSDPDLQQKQSLLSDQTTDNSNQTEVKIMLSKKKLEELLGKMEDLHNIPVNQILDRLIDSSDRVEIDHHHHHHLQQHPWRPNLKSIPEEN